MDNTRNSRRPGVYKLFKGLGAMNMAILPPKYQDGYLTRYGALLLEVAPAAGKQNWDWNQKITFAIGINDVPLLLEGGAREIFHSHNDTPKKLILTPGEGKYAGTYMLNIWQGSGQDRKSVSVPLTNGEHQVFMRLLVHALPSMLNWSEDAVASQITG